MLATTTNTQTKSPSVVLLKIEKKHLEMDGKRVTISQIFNKQGRLLEKKYTYDDALIATLFFQENKLKYQDFQPLFFTAPWISRLRRMIEDEILKEKRYKEVEITDLF